MSSSRRKLVPIVLLSLPAGILVTTLIWSVLGWPVSTWTFVIGVLAVGMAWALYARLRPAPKPVPEAPSIVWRPQRSGIDEVLLLDVTFIDAVRGWVVGGDGTILATTDGGKTWSRQNAGSRAELDAVSFSDPTHGWIVGNDESGVASVLSTEDGGVTWSEGMSHTLLLSDLAFPDTLHGWVVGERGAIFATSDGGRTWDAQTSGSASALLGVTFVDADHGWTVGVDNESGTGTILATVDGGETWVVQDVPDSGPLRAVAFSDTAHGWAVGDRGTILVTADGGEVWEARGLGRRGGNQKGISFHAVASPDPIHGWVVGYDDLSETGLILTTVDGGATWFRTTGSGSLYALAFPDDAHGWAVGYGDDGRTGTETGLILVATKGGA